MFRALCGRETANSSNCDANKSVRSGGPSENDGFCGPVSRHVRRGRGCVQERKGELDEVIMEIAFMRATGKDKVRSIFCKLDDEYVAENIGSS